MKKEFMGIAVAMGLLVGLITTASAGETDDIANIKKVLSTLMPQATPDSVKPAAFPGMYEAIYGPQVIYVSSDGRYMLEGDLYDLKNRTNLTETKRRAGRAKVINAIDEKSMIVFAPEKDKVKYIITAFTDVDCGYCRKLHRQIKEYNDLGIEMRYLAYPRSGVNTPSYFKAVSVWCSADRNKAMTEAKSGAKMDKKECDNPVKEHMAAAKEVGVSGTPTLVLESGQVIPGYVEPKRLLQILDQLKKG
jgi:thiol:disulfide interchange protein DsbC